jgi:hypothetical protein
MLPVAAAYYRSIDVGRVNLQELESILLASSSTLGVFSLAYFGSSLQL